MLSISLATPASILTVSHPRRVRNPLETVTVDGRVMKQVSSDARASEHFGRSLISDGVAIKATISYGLSCCLKVNSPLLCIY